jgi:hypothetical protein
VNWYDNENWTDSLVPTQFDSAWITNSDSFDRTVTLDLSTATVGLGHADNVILRLPVFSGRYTFAGDANLDGQVDVADLGALATNWQTSSNWTGGEFNYDGFVDVSDLGALATNWQDGAGSLTQAMGSLGFSRINLPEPAKMGALFRLSTAATRFRRRKSVEPVRRDG